MINKHSIDPDDTLRRTLRRLGIIIIIIIILLRAGRVLAVGLGALRNNE